MTTRTKRIALATGLVTLGCLAWRGHEPGTLRLLILDGRGGQPTMARVEVLDEKGKAHVAEDALAVGPGYADRIVPWQGDFEKARGLLSRGIENPYTRTTQFYSTGRATVTLPAGAYRVRVYKGIEYGLGGREVRIRSGEAVDLEVALERWVNLPEQGWYGSDDHLHISRPVKELDPIISKWMQAEGIHVANLLQFGTWKRFFGAPQYRHGPEGLYREGDYLLVSGQENPRTHFLGHTIVLGAKSAIHLPDRYLVYRNFWQEARRQGALSGYAHWGTGSDAPDGLAVDLPAGLLDFLEVMEAWDANYDIWYEILNSGIRMTPTAGTDYGTLPSLPGRERFYTRVEGPLTLQSWLEGIRRGATFVTNGPVLEFRVQGKGMGETVALAKAGGVRVEARVRFDPARDNVERLEVVAGGKLVKSCPRVATAGEIRCEFEHRVDESSWLAARTWGEKLGEASPPDGFVPPYRNRHRGAPASLAHTAAVYVTVKGRAGLDRSDEARKLARAWLARLDALEQRLAEDKLRYLSEQSSEVYGDVEYLRRNRAALLEAIQTSRKHFADRAR